MNDHLFNSDSVNYIVVTLVTVFLAPFVSQFLLKYFSLRDKITGKYFLIFICMTVFAFVSMLIPSYYLSAILLILSIHLLQTLIYKYKDDIKKLLNVKYLYFNFLFAVIGIFGFSDNILLSFFLFLFLLISVVLYFYILVKTKKDFSLYNFVKLIFDFIIRYYKICFIIVVLISFICVLSIKNIQIYEQIEQDVSSYVWKNCVFVGNYVPESIKENSKLLLWLKINKNINIIDKKAYKKSCIFGTVTIPANVTYISDEAFADCKYIRKVIFVSKEENDSSNNNGLILGNNVFENCENLKEIDFGNRVVATGSGICKNCKKLEKVKISRNTNYKTIEQFSFSCCENLHNVEVPENVKEIGKYAFENCIELYSIDFNNVEILNIGAFYNSGLFSVNTKKIMIIPESCFEGCTCFGENINIKNLFAYNIISFLYRKKIISKSYYDQHICNYREIYDKVKLTNVETIEANAFRDCINLDIIEDYDNLKYIGKNAFHGCDFAEFNLNNITKIDYCAFLNCDKINEFIIGSTPNFCIGEDKFLYEKDTENEEMLHLLCCPSNFEGNVTVGSNIIDIYPGAFANCKKIDKIKVEAGNQKFISDENAVYKKYKENGKEKKELICLYSGINTFNFTDKDTEKIGPFAFAGSELIYADFLDSGITHIEDSAFEKSIHLSFIKLPLNLKKLGKNTFRSCVNLSEITVPYKIFCIPEGAFENCEKLENVIIRGDLSVIGKNAFRNTGLKKFTFPKSLKIIKEGAFKDCDDLKDYKINSNILYVDENAFDKPKK